MANSSFGLSGFPTAPASIVTSSGANNPAASVTATVQSADGFASGELIYQRSNSFGTVPNTAVTSAVFSASQAIAVLGGATSTQSTTSNATNLGINGANSKAPYAAKLTNGNIVFVFQAAVTSTATGWVQTQNCVCFKIVTENGATVVDTTCIDTTNTAYSNFGSIGVVALSTGGFVIMYFNSVTTYPRYGVYTNTGSVTTALQDDTSLTTIGGNSYMTLGARSDGSWVACFGFTGNGIYAKVYSNTGAQVYAWTSLLSTALSANKIAMVVRNDNTVVILSINNVDATLGQYVVLSATNTVTVANTTFTAAGTNAIGSNNLDLTLLSTGTVLLTASSGGGSAIFYRTLTSANVLSSSSTASMSLSGLTVIYGYATIGTSSGGVFIVAITNSLSQLASYALFDSNFTNQFTKTLPYFGYTGSFNVAPYIIDTGTYYGVFYFPQANATRGYSLTLSRFNKTTLLPVNYTESTMTSGTTPAISVNGYARSGSTPSAAAFLAATSSTVYTSGAQTTGSFVLGPKQIANAGTFYELDSMTFADGRFGFVSRTSTGVITAYIYTVDGTLITTIAVATGASVTSAIYYTRMIELGDGKIVITYPSTSSPAALTIAVYSSAYAFISSTSFTPGLSGNEYNIGVAAISGNRILVTYSNASNNACFRVFSNAPAQVTAETVILGATCFKHRCAALGTGFIAAFEVSSNNQRYYNYYESANNVWTAASNTTIGSYNMWYNPKMNAHPVLWADYITNNTTATTNYFYTGVTAAARDQGISASPITTSNLTNCANCYTALGSGVAISYKDATSVSLYSSGNTTDNGSTMTAVTLNIATLNTTSALYRVTPNKGNRVVFSYISSADSLPYFVILDAWATPLVTSITSGVTSSTASLTLSQPTGYTLLGVSTSAAAAGGTGTVQINGPATLNANYSTTQSAAFDFQNPVTYGVKGIVNGLNVNLQGNV